MKGTETDKRTAPREERRKAAAHEEAEADDRGEGTSLSILVEHAVTALLPLVGWMLRRCAAAS